jgi:hypothetical protein
MTKTIQETGSDLSAEISSRIMTWTIYVLDEDKELEQFFEAIPGFCSSNVVRDLGCVFSKLEKMLAEAFRRFMSRTLFSNLVLEADKRRRVFICAKAVDTAHLPYATLDILEIVFEHGVDVVLRSVEIGQSLRNGGGQYPGLCAQTIVAGVIASVPERDERWVSLVKEQLGISEEVLRDYLAHSDAALLANLIHVSVPLLRLYLEDFQDMPYHCYQLGSILAHISKFDSQNTLPALQHAFYAMWNEITREAHNRTSADISYHILQPLHHLYVALHQCGDDAPTHFDPLLPFSYQVCNLLCHHSHSEITHRPMITSPTLALPNIVPDIIISSAGRVLSSLPAPNPEHGHTRPADEPSLNDVPQVTQATKTSHPIPSVDAESYHFSVTSFNPTTSFTTQGPVDTPAISSTTNSESDPQSASTQLPRPPIAPLSTIPPEHNMDIGVSPPSTVPGVISSPTTSGSRDGLLADQLSSLAPPASQVAQGIPEPGLLTSTSTPSTAPQQNASAGEHRPRPEMTVPKIGAVPPLLHSVDAASSCRDSDRSQ